MTEIDFDQLMKARTKWTNTAEIESTAEYAQMGFMLADQFESLGLVYMAASCRGRAQQYQQMSAVITGVRRIPDGQNFVILEPINGQPVLTS